MKTAHSRSNILKKHVSQKTFSSLKFPGSGKLTCFSCKNFIIYSFWNKEKIIKILESALIVTIGDNSIILEIECHPNVTL